MSERPSLSQFRSRRSAISPVLATVILIAITLVAGVAIAGFAFGLFGTLSQSANVRITRLTCTHGTAAASHCVARFQNVGNGITDAVSCSLSGADSTLPGSPVELDPGENTNANCRVAPAATFAGEPVEGSFTMANGVTVTFEGLYA